MHRQIHGSCETNPFKTLIERKDPIGRRIVPLTVGPCGQVLLPPWSRAEEREESENDGFVRLKDQLSSPINREEEGDKGEPFNKASGGPRRENQLPVPESPLRPI